VAPEREGSSPHSQQPATGPYPEQGESTSHPPANLPKIRSNSNLSSTPRSSKWSLSFGLSHQNFLHFSPLSHACHMPRPPHSPLFDLPNYIWRWVQIMKLPIVQVSPFSCHFVPLGSKYSSVRPVFKHPQSVLFATQEVLDFSDRKLIGFLGIRFCRGFTVGPTFFKVLM
jgi:hypothetical protein